MIHAGPGGRQCKPSRAVVNENKCTVASFLSSARKIGPAAGSAAGRDCAARAGAAEVEEDLLQESQLAAAGWRGAPVHFDDLAVFETILPEAFHLVVPVEADGDDLARQFGRRQEG